MNTNHSRQPSSKIPEDSIEIAVLFFLYRDKCFNFIRK